MPVATKSLHVANSFEDLMKLVDSDDVTLKEKHCKGKNLRMLCTSTKKVLEVADMHKNDGDEERSFFLYMRYFSMVDYIRTHKDYKKGKEMYDKLMMLDQCARVMDTMEQQKRSLLKRYAILKDAKEAAAKERKAEEAAAELMLKPSPPPQPPQPLEPASDGSLTKLPAVPDVIKPFETQLSSFKLLDMLQDKDTKVLIMDARPRQDFLDSHLKSSNCINIPEEVLKPGIIAEELSRSIPVESVELFEKRDVVDYVVLMDWKSADVPEDNQAPLKVLKDAIYKWSTQKVLKCEPMVLTNGYEDWLMRYPMHTTNAHTKVPEAASDPFVSNYSNSTEGVYFPDPDNLFEEAIRNKSQQGKPSGPASNTAAVSMPLVDRSKKPSLSNGPVPNSTGPKMVNGSSFNVPDPTGTKGGVFHQVDSAPKPLPGGPFGGLSQDSESGETEATSLEGIRQTENLKQKILDLTKDQLASEKEFELLRERKAREAEEELRRSVQEREEALQAHVRQLEKERAEVEQRVTALTRSNEQYEQKLKEKDKELIRIRQLNEEQRKADKEVHKLREERKRREQQEREEALKDSGKTVVDKAAVPSPPRSLKPTTNTAANNLKSQGTTATTPVERPQGVSMRSNNNLSRSRSFPNLSMASEESALESTGPATSATAPQFDRSLKPSQSVEANTAVITHQHRARAGDGINPRMRSNSPSSGREFKRSAGLRNLGNTCYMNATLQCLANTIPLALHFLSDRYKKDINRESHRSTGGEAAHEFKSLLSQMYYNDKSVSPKGFKSLMGRLFNVYAGYEQQDAHEFLLNFIDKLHEDLNKAVNRKGAPAPLPLADEANLSLNGRINRFWCQHLDRHLSVVSDLFEGLLVSNLTCLVCRKSSSSFEVFSCLSLPIPAVSGSVCYLQDCLKLFLETESMSGEAAWDCPTCKQKRKAEKRMIIARLPKILIVQFNRFRCETAWQSKKLQTYVHFPVNSFDMNCYVDHTRVDTQRRPPYNLYAFLNHYGTLATGHYIAYCRAGLGGQWYMYDDASVTEVTLSESDKRNAYILFYTSVDMRHQFGAQS